MCYGLVHGSDGLGLFGCWCVIGMVHIGFCGGRFSDLCWIFSCCKLVVVLKVYGVVFRSEIGLA